MSWQGRFADQKWFGVEFWENYATRHVSLQTRLPQPRVRPSRSPRSTPGFTSHASVVDIMTRTVSIDVVCDIEGGEQVIFGVAQEHRPDFPERFDRPLQEWVEETFGGEFESGEVREGYAEMEYEPDGEIIEFRRMHLFETGDRVRIDIPDETDADHRYHGQHGEVIEVVVDDAGEETGDERDAVSYRVVLENGETMYFRWRDLRPPFND